jgi:hypothetical protein
MRAEVHYVGPVNESVLPRIRFEFYVSYRPQDGVPFFNTGQLKSGNKYLSKLEINTEHVRNNSSRLELLRNEDFSPEDRKLRLSLYAEFSEKIVQFIEDARSKDPQRNVHFQFELIFDVFKSKRNSAGGNKHSELGVEQEVEHVSRTIEHSAWVNNYSQLMGVDKFLLFEYQVIQPVQGDVFSARWKEILDRSRMRVAEMEQELKNGQWGKVIESSRMVFDTLKFSKNKKEERDELKQLFEANNYSDEGVNDLIESIWSIHEFASKFLHDKPKKPGPEGYLNPVPVAQKEDAYFIYSLAIGLVNMLGVKVEQMSKSNK